MDRQEIILTNGVVHNPRTIQRIEQGESAIEERLHDAFGSEEELNGTWDYRYVHDPSNPTYLRIKYVHERTNFIENVRVYDNPSDSRPLPSPTSTPPRRNARRTTRNSFLYDLSTFTNSLATGRIDSGSEDNNASMSEALNHISDNLNVPEVCDSTTTNTTSPTGRLESFNPWRTITRITRDEHI